MIPSHPGAAFVARIYKRHPAPFWIDRTLSPNAKTAFRLLDGRDDLVATFSKWHYAVLAAQALAARCGAPEPSDGELRRLLQEAQWARARRHEARRPRRQMKRA